MRTQLCFKIQLCILLLLLGNISCQNENRINQTIENIKISKNEINHLLDYSDKIIIEKIIRLETNDECNISKVTKILFRNGKFYIFDRYTQSIYLFSENGKYLSKLNKMGNGPQEYTELMDFDINEKGEIFILSQLKFMIFDSTLNFRNQIEIKEIEENGIKYPPVLFALNDTYKFVFKGSFGIKKDSKKIENNYSIYCIDSNNKHCNRFFPLEFTYPYFHQTFYKSYDNLLVTGTYGNDTIYVAKKNKLHPLYYIDFGNSKVLNTLMKADNESRYNKFVSSEFLGGIENTYENTNYLSFMVSFKGDKKQIVVNKFTKQLYVLNLSEKMKPLPWMTTLGLSGDRFFSIIEPYLLQSSNVIIDKSYDIYFKDVKINDNPIIVIFNYIF